MSEGIPEICWAVVGTEFIWSAMYLEQMVTDINLDVVVWPGFRWKKTSQHVSLSTQARYVICQTWNMFITLCWNGHSRFGVILMDSRGWLGAMVAQIERFSVKFHMDRFIPGQYIKSLMWVLLPSTPWWTEWRQPCTFLLSDQCHSSQKSWISGSVRECLEGNPWLSLSELCISANFDPEPMWGCPRGVVVKTMDCRIIVSEFKLQLRYYVHFRANTSLVSRYRDNRILWLLNLCGPCYCPAYRCQLLVWISVVPWEYSWWLSKWFCSPHALHAWPHVKHITWSSLHVGNYRIFYRHYVGVAFPSCSFCGCG